MKEKDAKKLINYVSGMVEKYDVISQRVQRELSGKDTEVDEALEEIHISLEGKSFCDECDNMKLKDEIRDEYYCPRCEV